MKSAAPDEHAEHFTSAGGVIVVKLRADVCDNALRVVQKSRARKFGCSFNKVVSWLVSASLGSYFGCDPEAGNCAVRVEGCLGFEKPDG